MRGSSDPARVYNSAEAGDAMACQHPSRIPPEHPEQRRECARHDGNRWHGTMEIRALTYLFSSLQLPRDDRKIGIIRSS